MLPEDRDLKPIYYNYCHLYQPISILFSNRKNKCIYLNHLSGYTGLKINFLSRPEFAAAYLISSIVYLANKIFRFNYCNFNISYVPVFRFKLFIRKLSNIIIFRKFFYLLHFIKNNKKYTYLESRFMILLIISYRHFYTFY